MNRALALLALPCLFALAACGDAKDADSAGSTSASSIPQNQGTSSGTVGDGNPDVTQAPTDAAPATDQTSKQVGGMSYPVTGQ